MPLPSVALHLPPRRKHAEGIALVVVLFALALVTIVILAFFNLALLNRNISFSSAGQARANILALSALDYIKGDFIAEIQAGSVNEIDPGGSGIPIYLPTTNAAMTPYRMTTNVAPTSGYPPSLVKWSSGTYPLWPATPTYGNQAGPTRAYAGAGSGTASVNGHFIDSSRWTKPDFGTNTTFPAKITPEWVYLTRRGILTNAAPVLSTLANAASTNPSYVVGRYAYTVYDEGGLLDVAAAGYSPSLFSTLTADLARKGNQGFADLTQLDPTLSLLTKSQIDAFVNWRNAQTGATTASYLTYLTNTAPATGFLKAASGDQAFLSRQDLIQYWTGPLAASSKLLPYLTTFTREKNAPSWGPQHDANDAASATYWNGTNTDTAYDSVSINNTDPISYAYRSNQDSASAHNRFLPQVRVKTAFTRLSNSPAVVGEPLIKNRFDLNKLAWITYNGVLPSGVTAQDVYNSFGLTRNYSSSGVFQSWTYNHTTATVPTPGNGTLAPDTSSIMTLDQVASLNSTLAREPDFFELLQAVILRGSLGLCSGDPTQASTESNIMPGGEFYRANFYATIPGNSLNEGGALFRSIQAETTGTPHVVNAQSMFQIVQIGANIIDQYDSDNYPTELILYGEHFYGIENLPYINSVGDSALRVAAVSPPASVTPTPMSYDITSDTDSTISGKTAYQAYVHRWLNFALWNPHQNAANPPTAGPTKIRICAAGGTEFPYISTLGNFKPVTAAAGGTDFSGRSFLPPGSTVTTPSAGSPDYAVGPAWIGLALSDYGNFPEPTMLDYTKSYTSDSSNGANSGSLNINHPNGRVATSLGWQRAGIYLGWSKSPDNPYKVPACAGLWPNFATSASGTAASGNVAVPTLQTAAATMRFNPGLTLYLQYEDPSRPGTWRTYEELRNLDYARAGGGDSYMEPSDPGWNAWLASATGPTVASASQPPASSLTSVVKILYGTAITTGFTGAFLNSMDTTAVTTFDPRTTRLNLWSLHNGTPWGRTGGTGTDYMVTSTIATIGEPSKGIASGPHFQDPTNAANAAWVSFAKTWVDNVSVAPKNNYDNTGITTYFRDRDYIARRGDAAGWNNVVLPADDVSGIKNASPLTSGAKMQRPLHLDRPFRSVGELGYVFRDDPWKTLNLISANSADAGLLDVFYIGTGAVAPPPDVIAGRMNLNSAALNTIQAGVSPMASPVVQALLSQSLRDYQSPSGAPTVLDTALTTASDIKNLSTNVVNFVRVNGPLVNLGDLPGAFPQIPASTPTTPFLYTGLKNPSEAMIRALADSTGTRTWNLMIDVVAQSGKLSPAAVTLNDFIVEGEKHYWLHVAIDRFTGEVIDQQLEPVWE